MDDPIVAMERAALVRWLNGDPSGFLEICASDVVYFDPIQPRRLDSLTALAEYYENLRGKIFAERYELINPRVQYVGDCAVLTFNFNSYADGSALRWNCTEAFRRDPEGWRIIQTHWSFTEAGVSSAT